MIKITFLEKSYEIKNEIKEFTIGEFEDICRILNSKEKNYIDKWIDIFSLLGIPENISGDWDTFAFMKVIKEFNLSESQVDKVFKKDIKLNDEIYSYTGDEFKLTVREMRLIEDAVKKNESRYLGELLAIIYKREDLDKSITYDLSHIKYKAEMIRKQIKADIVIPYMAFLSKKLINDNESTK